MDITKLVVAIQRSNITSEYRGFVVKAVQEYMKYLDSVGAIKVTEAKKVEVQEIVEETVKEAEVQQEAEKEFKAKAKVARRKKHIKNNKE